MQIKTERLLLLLAIPLIVAGAPLAVMARSTEVLFEYRPLVFLLSLFLSTPLTVVVALSLRWAASGQLGRLVWIRQPSTSLQIEPTGSIAGTAGVVRRRLADCGFSVREHAGPGSDLIIDFTKQKAARTHSFIDHAFRGTVSLSAAAARPEVSITLVFDDTVLIETGEYAKLRALAGYLLGTESSLAIRQPPLTLVCGVTLATANVAILIVGLLDHPAWVAPTFTTSLAAAALCVWGLVVVLKDRAHLEGLGLATAGLAAAAVPFLMLL